MKIFIAAAFEWRQSAAQRALRCTQYVLSPGDRCTRGTNRNFPDGVGAGARTHLMSPAMVAAAAVEVSTGRCSSLLWQGIRWIRLPKSAGELPMLEPNIDTDVIMPKQSS